MPRYLIDADVMVDVSRRNAAAATCEDSLDEITISIITAHELIVGAKNQRDAELLTSNTALVFVLVLADFGRYSARVPEPHTVRDARRGSS